MRKPLGLSRWSSGPARPNRGRRQDQLDRVHAEPRRQPRERRHREVERGGFDRLVVTSTEPAHVRGVFLAPPLQISEPSRIGGDALDPLTESGALVLIGARILPPSLGHRCERWQRGRIENTLLVAHDRSFPCLVSTEEADSMRTVALAGWVFVVGCSVHVSRGSESDREPVEETDAADPYRLKAAAASKQRQVREESAEDARDDRQAECRSTLEDIEASRAREKEDAAIAEALASCPDTGIPAGTYKTADGLPHVELEVTERGCAAYEAFARIEKLHVRTHDGVPYLAPGSECTVGGTLTSDRKPKHARFEADCRRKVFDVLSEGDAWAFTSTGTPTVTVTTSEDPKRRIVLRRSSPDVPVSGGLPRLWAKQRTESDDAARASIAFAKDPKPGLGVGCAGLPLGDPGCAPARRDYCAELARMRTKNQEAP